MNNLAPIEVTNFYKSNPKLRAYNVNIEYTEQQVIELYKCIEDPIYFIENYCKIVHVDKGIVPFMPYEYQKRLILDIHNNRFNILKAPRQCGKTTSVAALICWYLLFRANQTIAVLANKDKQAKEVLDRVKFMYENVPLWMQSGVVSWNKTSIELENNNKIVTAATSSSAIRGMSITWAYLDEFAFVRNNLQEEFFTSTIPTVSSGETTKITITSTPNGYNLFYKIWTDATSKKNEFVPTSVHYSETPGRDEQWAEKQKAVLGELKFRQEYLTDFLGSSNTLISASHLSRLVYNEPISVSDDGTYKKYKESEPKRIYSIHVDVAEGVGGDYAAASVIDITNMPFTVAATYRSNQIDPLALPALIKAIAEEYNNAYILVESNGIGKQVANQLFYDYEYEYVISSLMRKDARKETTATIGDGKPELGVKTTKATKRIGVATLKSLIERDQLIINDYQILYELARFIQKGSSYQAELGETDDMIMTLVTFAWLTNQNFFQELTNFSTRRLLGEKSLSEIQQQLNAFIPTSVQVHSEKINISGIDVDDYGYVNDINAWLRN